MAIDSCNSLKDRCTDQWDSTEIPTNPHICGQLNIDKKTENSIFNK